MDQTKIPTLVVLPSGRAVNLGGVLDAEWVKETQTYSVLIAVGSKTEELLLTGEDADAAEQAVRSFAMYVLRPKDAPPALVVPGKTILQ